MGSQSLRNTIIAISVALIPALARVVCATLSLREEPFVEAARAVGMSETRIAISHVLPNPLAGVEWGRHCTQLRHSLVNQESDPP